MYMSNKRSRKKGWKYWDNKMSQHTLTHVLFKSNNNIDGINNNVIENESEKDTAVEAIFNRTS